MKRVLVAASVLMALGLGVGVVLNRESGALVPGNNILVGVNASGTGPSVYGTPDVPPGDSLYTPMSANGRYVAYYSSANDLVLGDTNNRSDVFVRDLENNTTIRANLSSSGVQADAGLPKDKAGNLLSLAQSVAISGTGRYVAFISAATNLIDGQTIPSYLANQVYLRDTKTNEISIVTKTSSGDLGMGNPGRPSPMYVKNVSDDGRFVLWGGFKNIVLGSSTTGTNGTGYAYLTDLKNNTARLVTAPATYTGNVLKGYDANMSCDGAYIVFSSDLAFDSADSNNAMDLFLVDVREGYSTTRLTNAVGGATPDGVSISCNGRYITFKSKDDSFSSAVASGNTVIHSYLYDVIEGEYTLLQETTGGSVGNDHSLGLVAVDDRGNVAFTSRATNLIDGAIMPSGALYFRDNSTGSIEVLSLNIYGSPVAMDRSSVSISSDGTKVAYYTPAYTVAYGNPMFPGATNMRAVIVSETGL